ncbi:MAG: hypothetical protein GTN80_00310 [Nitrososphaeria archaeon]|nr:hypothetical protein [Nitrososphaeria archaeon]NIN51603.1 hypothetical protein [Nitrososphaeria archaeon]NIQ32088.1 hypothetical protein [Nitrososphaeria archaeon]
MRDLGLFDFILKRGKKELAQPLDIPLHELDVLFDDETKIYFEELAVDSKKMLDKIQIVIDRFRDDIDSLEEAEIEEEKVDQRLLRIVLNNRTSLVKKMQSFVNSINVPSQTNYKTVLEFHDSILKRMGDINVKSVKSYQRTKILFGSEVSQILKDLKIMNRLVAELVDPIREKEELIKDIEETREEIGDLKEEISSLDRSKMDLEDRSSTLEKLIKEKNEIQKSLEKMVKSEEWSFFNKLKQEREEIQTDIREVRNQIIQTVSPLRKVLKKFKNIDREKKILKNEIKLDFYIDSPVEALIADKGLEKLKTILNNVEECILSREIRLKKDKRREKTLSSIKKIVRTETLKELIEKHNDLTTKVEFLDKTIDSTKFKQKEILENELEAIKSRIKELEDEEQKSNRKNEVIKESISNRKTLLESKIERITNRKINIQMDRPL